MLMKLNIDEILYWDIRELSKMKGKSIEDYCIYLLTAGVIGEKRKEVKKTKGQPEAKIFSPEAKSLNEVKKFRMVRDANNESQKFFSELAEYVKDNYKLLPIEKQSTIVYDPNFIAFEHLGKRNVKVQISLQGEPGSFSIQPTGLRKGRLPGWSRYDVRSREDLERAYKLIDEAFKKSKR